LADLYSRLEEIQGMVHVLTKDIELLQPLLGNRSIQSEPNKQEEANRRFFIRAIFSLIEAVVEQHKRLLLDLHEHNAIKLDSGVRNALSERIYIVRENGNVSPKEKYLNLKLKLRVVYKVAGDTFDNDLNIRFDDEGWNLFISALKIRHRITHPKNHNDCVIEGNDLDVVDKGHTWFRIINNEFVRVARAHREKHNW